MDLVIVVCGFIVILLPVFVADIVEHYRNKQKWADEVARWRTLRRRAHTKKGGK